jgi:hypothetical protein
LTVEEENKVQAEIWPGDIEIAFQYLLAQPGVAREQIGAGGASCGVYNAIKLARRHSEVKSLVLLAGPTDREGRQFLQSSKNIPIFTSAADDDVFGPQALMMQWFFSLSLNSASRFAHYASGGHGAEMFTVQKELPGIITDWFLATLLNRPDRLPKTNGQAMEPKVLHNLELIDQPGGGGADEVAKIILAGGRAGAEGAMFPEFIVNLLGYEHIQAGDIKGAVEILKLNAMAYPNSPNVYDSVSDAYLADGQKDMALQNAKKAVALHRRMNLKEGASIPLRGSVQTELLPFGLPPHLLSSHKVLPYSSGGTPGMRERFDGSPFDETTFAAYCVRGFPEYSGASLCVRSSTPRRRN